MKKQKFTVRISFPHLKGWEKDVEVEAVDKHKAIIAAEKAYPQGKAVGFINESRTKDRTPLDDMKDCINNALVSNVNPTERMMEFDKRYGKHQPSIMVGGFVNAEWGTAAGPSEKVTVLTDPFHLGSLKIGDRVKVIIIKEE